MKSFDLLYNKKVYNSIDKNKIKIDITKTYYFPCLSHKELISLNDLKHQFYFNSRQKREQNNMFNFHTEVLKTNFKGNSKYITINSNLSNQTPNDSKFPEINNKNKIKKGKFIKLYMNQNTINNSFYNKNKKNKSKNVLKYNKTANKFNMSNISTKANFSLSVKNHNLSKKNKISSLSGDLNNISYFNTNKYPNNSNNILNENSLEHKNTIFNFNDSSTSLPKYETIEKYNSIDNFFLSNNNSSYINENINKKFLSNLNPIYALLRNEFLSEFHRKTKNISYLKYFFRNKSINLELEKEKRISDIQKMDLNTHNIKLLLFLFDKFNDSKFEYLNYLKKTVTKEKEKNKILKEDKITIMNEIYTIRHKTLRLENRFKNYLNDKFFLLSVKNHSFSINKFTKEDQDDYNRDLKKLDILNIMLKITEKEYEKENENDKNTTIPIVRKDSTSRTKLSKISSKNVLFSNNIPKSPIKSFRKQSTKMLTKKYYSLYDSKPILTMSQNKLLKPNFKAYGIYSDVKDFNRDLKQTSNNIQYSLVQYNKISKELQIMRYNLYKKKIELKNLKKYEDYLKETIEFHKKNLENIKTLNLNLQNYKNYLLNIDVLNLNKGLVDFKITKIVKKICNSKDDILLKYLENINIGNGKNNLLFIERAIEFLLNFKEKQKLNANMKYLIIQRKIEDKNRIKSSMFKQENTRKKIDSLIEKVINKNKKIIFVSRRKVNYEYNPEIKNRRKQKTSSNLKNYFGNFDLD